jgi:hypothetical protein
MALAALLALPVAHAAAPDLSGPPTAADRAALAAGGWAAARDVLGQRLAKAYQPGSATYPGASADAAYQSWLLLWQWCELLAREENAEADKFLADHLYVSPADTTPALLLPGYAPPPDARAAPVEVPASIIASAPARDRALRQLLRDDALPTPAQPLAALVPPRVLAQWLADENFSRMLFANLAPEDYAPGVLRALAQMQQAHPGDFAAYPALALAIALVYDQKMPAYWPHAQVAAGAVPIKIYTPAEWFAFWVVNAQGKGNLLDVRALDVAQVKFLVDAPLDPAEYAWAKANVRYGRGDFDQAYSSITYDDKRYAAAAYDWTNGNYTLAAIKKNGGICVDQAYFAVIAGKARGLPTLFFTGTGKDGPHAWFGYLTSNTTWRFDCGRYANQNFATGQALDPQTWQPLTDHELASLAGRFRTQPRYAASQDDVVMAGLFAAQGQMAQARAALDSAIATCPMNPEAWDAKTAFLEGSGAPAADLRAHHLLAVKQFSSQPDLKAYHLNALADLARAAGDTAAAQSYENQIVSQNAGGRTDLGVSEVAKQMQLLVSAGQYGEALQKYGQHLDSVGQAGGSGEYYQVVQPFVQALLAAGKASRAEQAVQLARQKLSPATGTMVQRELDALEDQVLSAPKTPTPATGLALKPGQKKIDSPGEQ